MGETQKFGARPTVSTWPEEAKLVREVELVERFAGWLNESTLP